MKKKNNVHDIDHKRAQREAQIRKAKDAKVARRIIVKANEQYRDDNG